MTYEEVWINGNSFFSGRGFVDEKLKIKEARGSYCGSYTLARISINPRKKFIKFKYLSKIILSAMEIYFWKK